MTVDLGANTASGGTAAGDTLTSIETLWGSDHDDHLTGDGTANVLEGGAGANPLDGGGGTDTAAYDGSAQAVTVNLGTNTASGGDAAGDTLTSIENLRGSRHADWLTGAGTVNALEGRDGADVLEGGAGADLLWGGPGTYDRAAYTESKQGVTVNLTDGTARGGDAQVTIDGVTLYDTLIGIKDLEGSDAADELTGNGGNNYLVGRKGNDTLKGEGGNDELIGGLGQDTLSGGTGADTFIFDEADASPVGTRDVVTDFSGLGADGVKQASEEGDKLDFTDLTEGTTLNVKYQQFGTGSAAKTIVQVNVDGDGALKTGEDFHLELTGHHALTAADFEFDEGTVSVVEVSDIVIA